MTRGVLKARQSDHLSYIRERLCLLECERTDLILENDNLRRMGRVLARYLIALSHGETAEREMEIKQALKVFLEGFP